MSQSSTTIVTRLFPNSLTSKLIRTIINLLPAVVIGLIIFGVFSIIHTTQQSDRKTLHEAASAYHYKINEHAYCDQPGEGSSRTWKKCTVIAHSGDYTSYFVDYGSSQDNISVEDMQRTTQ